MKANLTLPASILVSLSTYFSGPLDTLAQGTAFTYQGRLVSGTNGANGIYDFRFRLFDDANAGAQIGPSLANSAVTVSNGYFTAVLDFANGAFPGTDRWLEISVRSNTIVTFSVLSPRQKITATPYAITASNLSGTVAASGLAGSYSSAVVFNNPGNSFTGNGAGLHSLDASQLTGGTVPSAALDNAWKTTGNAGTTGGGHFIGTTDNQPLEIKVNGTRALRIVPRVNDSPNLIGGSPANFIATNVNGSFIGGGGSTTFSNRIASSFAVIGGGTENSIETNSLYSFIGGGLDNNIQEGGQSVIIGGQLNRMTNATHSFIGAGVNNFIDGSSGFLGGGTFQRISAQNGGFIGGGTLNQVGGTLIAGGTSAVTNNNNAIAGGVLNWIMAGGTHCFIGGGKSNRISIGVTGATIPGGQNNLVAGDHALAAGFRAKAIHDGAFVWADSIDSDFASSSSNQFLIRATGGVGINVTNPVDALHVQSDESVRTRTTTTGTGFAGFVSENSLGEWFAGVATGTNHWYLFENAPASGARIVVKSGGNVGIGTLAPTNRLHVAGGVSATAFVNTSDRNAKENFAPVSPQEILNKVAALPISTWNFKTMNDGRHMGPTAQDFHAAFGLGGGDTTITSIDPDGVALAAIQGLNEKVETRSQKLEAENAELKSRLEKLERLMNDKQNGGAK